MWRSDLSHLRDKYTKTIPLKTFDFSSFIRHISCALFVGRFWLISPNEMSTCHGSNQFHNVTIVAWKIGKEFTWQKECTFVWGWGNTSKYRDSLPDRKQTLMLLSRVRSISFRQGICQLSQITLSVHAGLDSQYRLLWAWNLLISVSYIAMSHFQLCLSFLDSATGNEMQPVSPLISFEMMNTSGAINSNKSNSLMQHCGGEGELVTAAKSASLPPIN